MRITFKKLLVGVFTLWLGSSLAWAGDPGSGGMQDVASPYMRVYGVTPPPYGHVDFCRRAPEECLSSLDAGDRVAGNTDQLNLLAHVNRSVNKAIKPMTDMEQYGVEDYWAIPVSGKGDCEDFQLLKRQILIRAGWPASSLLMTVVYDEKREGHAVLTARTVAGDFILDNKTDEVKLWSKTPYHYLMRQSYLDPQVWMSLDADIAVPSIPVGARQINKTWTAMTMR